MKELLQETTAYRLLKNEGEQNRLSHTYLLLMDDEKNLRLALKEFAKLFFPSQAVKDRIERESYTDCLFYPQGDKPLDKDATTAIIDESCLSPVEGERKVFVLCDMHKASPIVQNKLLKVLEEPPQNVYFLLGATSEFPLLTTVKSRAKKLEISAFSTEQVGACLERTYPTRSKEELMSYAFASGGSVGRAQNLLLGGRYQTLTEKAYACVSARGGQIVSAVKDLQTISEKQEFLSLLSSMYRDMLFYKAGQKEYAILPAIGDKLKELAKSYTNKKLIFALDRMTEAEKDITFFANFAQCIEVNLMKIEKENEK